MARLERQRLEVGPDGWTCHVCHEYRPDALIGVFSKTVIHKATGVQMRMNVRYCRDRPECYEGAQEKSWVAIED